MHSSRVVVVGTTSDYIELIRRRYPHRALFLTDPAERARASEETPGPAEEILCHFTNDEEVHRILKNHLRCYALAVDGVACFDCEYLSSAAVLAEGFGLPFPSPFAVAQSRNKFLSKAAWKRAEVVCPEAVVVHNLSEIYDFFNLMGKPVILKPLTGSGGELVFRCDDQPECLQAYETIINHLTEAGENRLYLKDPQASGDLDPLQDVVLEEFIPGQEYSCDFLLQDGSLEVIRTAKKIPTAGGQVGATTAAYLVPAVLPGEIPLKVFLDQLYRAATALGLDRALCMVDFIVWQGKAFLLELTPRPGGDCLPWLIQQSCGLDMIGLALDMAQGRDIFPLPTKSWETLVGLRLFAKQAGTVKEIDEEDIRRHPRVHEVLIKRRPGHRVVLPPEDYDSRLLGHVIFRPTGSASLETECTELASKLKVVMEIEG